MSQTLPSIDETVSHRAALGHLVRECGWRRGAEIGLGSGHLSRLLLLTCPELELIGVDLMRRADRAGNIRALEGEFYPRYRVFRDDSARAARHVDDRSLDFVFIDAGHSYKAVHGDIKAWHRKVADDGWLLGHDYGHPRFDGVATAVDEWFGRRAQILAHTIWAVPGARIHAPVGARR